MKSDLEKSIVSRNWDFWLLGGGSLVFLAALLIASSFRESSLLFQQKFIMLVPLFGMLSLICNHPHFIISYKFGYTRGSRFIFQNWFALIFVPVGLFAVFVFSFLTFDQDVSSSKLVMLLNRVFEFLSVDFRFGESLNMGQELLGLTVWIMYLTVGWHYSKQVFGCMMVYSRFDKIEFTVFEKNTIKWSLLSLASYQFLSSSQKLDASLRAGYSDQRFLSLSITPLGLPEWLTTVSQWTSLIGFIFVAILFYKKFSAVKRWPSATILVVWISIYLWWIPIREMPEYYFLAVPFFHSLQYLPFAYKLEAKTLRPTEWLGLQVGFRLGTLLLIGFLLFELVPSLLDSQVDSKHLVSAYFFVTSFAVFINIHHFFIDSVVWKFNSQFVQKGFVYEGHNNVKDVIFHWDGKNQKTQLLNLFEVSKQANMKLASTSSEAMYFVPQESAKKGRYKVVRYGFDGSVSKPVMVNGRPGYLQELTVYESSKVAFLVTGSSSNDTDYSLVYVKSGATIKLPADFELLNARTSVNPSGEMVLLRKKGESNLFLWKVGSTETPKSTGIQISEKMDPKSSYLRFEWSVDNQKIVLQERTTWRNCELNVYDLARMKKVYSNEVRYESSLTISFSPLGQELLLSEKGIWGNDASTTLISLRTEEPREIVLNSNGSTRFDAYSWMGGQDKAPTHLVGVTYDRSSNQQRCHLLSLRH